MLIGFAMSQDRRQIRAWLYAGLASVFLVWILSQIQPEATEDHGLGESLATLRSAGALRRGEAAKKLGEMGDQRAVASLIVALRDDADGSVRVKSLEAIARLRSVPAGRRLQNELVPTLVVALKDRYPGVRVRAILQLKPISRAENRLVAPALLETLGDPVPEVRKEAALAIPE